jgi:hypothetical protein
MQVMFFEAPPGFDGLLAQLASLEHEINHLG